METRELQLEHFAPLVDETFVADFGADGTLDLVLTEAVEQPTGNTGETAFAVLFRGPADPVFDQATVPLRHPTVGEHVLMLVAVGEDDTGRSYEAVFTRINP